MIATRFVCMDQGTLAPGVSTAVETNGVTLHVREAGPDDGPPVVLLHGFPEFWYGWHRQIGPIADAGYRVLAPDGRGYNRSDKPDSVRAYQIEELAGDVIGLLDAHGYDRASFVGHDWGALIGWWLAFEYPDRLDRLCVVNVPHSGVFGDALSRSWRQQLSSTYALFFQLPWLPETVCSARNWKLLTGMLTGSSQEGTFSTNDLRRYRSAWEQPGAFTGMLNWYRAVGRNPAPFARWDRVTVPALVLWGTRDKALRPELASRSAAMCDDGSIELFEDATHWLQHEKPSQVTTRLLSFLG
jgi:pimeloyl-ACP methyl ester carboxylesterase